MLFKFQKYSYHCTNFDFLFLLSIGFWPIVGTKDFSDEKNIERPVLTLFEALGQVFPFSYRERPIPAYRNSLDSQAPVVLGTSSMILRNCISMFDYSKWELIGMWTIFMSFIRDLQVSLQNIVAMFACSLYTSKSTW